jgi:hypothetical protein
LGIPRKPDFLSFAGKGAEGAAPFSRELVLRAEGDPTKPTRSAEAGNPRRIKARALSVEDEIGVQSAGRPS